MSASGLELEENNFPYRGFIGRFLTAAFLAVVGPLAFIIWSSLAELDRKTEEHQQHLVRVNISAQAEQVQNALWTALAWDEPVLFLERGFDRDWTQDNVGRYLYDIQKFSYSFAYAPDDRVLYAAQDGQDMDLAAARMMTPVVRQFIDDLRRAEQAPKSTLQQPKTLTLPPPRYVQEYIRFNDTPYLVTALLITGARDSLPPKNGRHAIVIAFKRVDSAFFRTMIQSEQVKGAAIGLSCEGLAERRSCLAVKGRSADPVFAVTWDSNTGIGRISMRILYLAGFLALLLVMLAAFFLQRGRAIHKKYLENRDRVTFMAFHDALTQLPNRVLAFDRLDRMIRSLERNQKWIAIHALDLDLFKHVNDSRGHAVGDELLRAVAERLRLLCRASDTVSRLGGDEFLLLQSVDTPAQAATLAMRIVSELSKPFDLSCGPVKISCSIGTVTSDSAQAEAALLVRQADAALYKAKSEGGGLVTFFDEDLDRLMRTRKAMENDLRQAISENAVNVVYQEILDRDGRCVSVEALARWDHPQGRDIPPQEFIRIAEDSHQAYDLGAITLGKVADDSQGLSGIRICINVSPMQLRSQQFVALLIDFLETKFSRHCTYELEITETALLVETPSIADALLRLRRAGYSIALDDFGTGYSSLTHIRNFEFDRIKIDRSFVADITVDPRARSVVEAILQISHALGIETVAEGVESEEIFALLREIGVPLVQGYAFGKPVDGKEIAKILSHAAPSASAAE